MQQRERVLKAFADGLVAEDASSLVKQGDITMYSMVSVGCVLVR
jgi:hypothetical protein